MTGGDFWSRRKASVEAEERAEDLAQEATEQRLAEESLAQRSDEDLLQELDLPEPETLENSEQVQEFLKAALPQRLKNRALRRLWRLNPVLANVDGLVEYGEDYTDAATVVENMQTVYQVGKGMVAKFEEFVAELSEDDEPGEDERPDAAQASEDVAADRTTDLPEATTPEALPQQPDAEPEPEPLRASSRRMKFQFDTVA